MDNDKLRQITELAIRITEKGQHLKPLLIMEDKHGKMAMVLIENVGPDNIDDIMRTTGKKLATFRPKTITFICESWHADTMPPECREVHDMAHVQQCILVTSQEIGGEASMRTIPYSYIGKAILPDESYETKGRGGSILKSFWQGVPKGYRRQTMKRPGGILQESMGSRTSRVGQLAMEHGQIRKPDPLSLPYLAFVEGLRSYVLSREVKKTCGRSWAVVLMWRA